MTFFFGSIYLFQKRQWAVGAIAFSAGVAVKMTLLVALPAVAIILVQANGVLGSLRLGLYMLLVQVSEVKIGCWSLTFIDYSRNTLSTG